MLAGIKFDYSLLVGNGLDLVARRDAHDDAFKGFFVQRKPIGHSAAAGAFEVLGGQLPGGVGILDFDHVVHFQAEGRDVDFPAVDADVTVVDDLAGREGATRRRRPRARGPKSAVRRSFRTTQPT